MRRTQRAAAALLAAAAFAAPAALAATDGAGTTGAPSDNQRVIRGCITAAADVYRLPPAVLVILLNVEGGSLGRVSQNTNDTIDIGPMQVNQIWLPQVAAHWHATQANAYRALRDNFCANVEAGAWILRQGLDEAHGDFWEGVGYYHSHDPEHKATYLRDVLQQVLRLRALVVRVDATSARLSTGSAQGPVQTPGARRALITTVARN